MPLVEAGKLTLDEPISQCIPQYKAAQVPTVRQLLTHTSGVRHYRCRHWGQSFSMGLFSLVNEDQPLTRLPRLAGRPTIARLM